MSSPIGRATATVIGDDISEHYAAWLLQGLGFEVDVFGSPSRAALQPTSRWLLSEVAYQQASREDALSAARSATVVLVGAGSQLTLDFVDDVRRAADENARTVVVAISPYGLTGPMAFRKGTGQEVQAASGMLGVTGRADEAPCPMGGDLIAMATGTTATLAALLGLFRLMRTGEGDLVDVSAIETATGLQSSWGLYYAYAGLIWRRNAEESLATIMPCKDGYLALSFWSASLEVCLNFLELSLEDLPEEVRDYPDTRGLTYNSTVVEVFKKALAARTRQEWIERGQEWRIPGAPLMAAGELVDDPHLDERGFFTATAIDGELVKVPAYPFQSDLWRSGPLPAPPLPSSPDDLARTRPLSGVRVVEFGLAWSAPMAAEILALYGATVTKVEPPTRIDTGRALPLLDLELRRPWWEYSSNYHPVNAGKRHLGLNIEAEGGKDVRDALLRTTDIVLTNYSRRALTHLGLDGSSIQATNPRCSVVHSTGYGWTGPYRDRTSYGSAIEGMTGLAWETGGHSPVRSRLLHPDIFSALHTVIAAVASLIRRESTGLGTVTDLGQLECGLLPMATRLIHEQLRKPVPQRALHLRLRCKGEDQWAAVTLDSRDQWPALLRTLGITNPGISAGNAWTSPREAADALREACSAWFKEDLADALQAAAIAAEPVLYHDEMNLSAHLRARGHFLRVEHGDFGARLIHSGWMHFRSCPVTPVSGTHEFGEDNEIVVRELMGERADIDALTAAGALGRGPRDVPDPAGVDTLVDDLLRSGSIYRWDPDHASKIAEFYGAGADQVR